MSSSMCVVNLVHAIKTVVVLFSSINIFIVLFLISSMFFSSFRTQLILLHGNQYLNY